MPREVSFDISKKEKWDGSIYKNCPQRTANSLQRLMPEDSTPNQIEKIYICGIIFKEYNRRGVWAKL